MKNLLIVAHGSRREQSNIEIQLLAEKVVAEMPFFLMIYVLPFWSLHHRLLAMW